MGPWIVIVSTLVLSDAGTHTMTDMPIYLRDEDACRRIERERTATDEIERYGKRYTAISKARCYFDGKLIGQAPPPPEGPFFLPGGYTERSSQFRLTR